MSGEGLPRDPGYYRRRAEQELEAARRSRCGIASRRHSELADLLKNKAQSGVDEREPDLGPGRALDWGLIILGGRATA